MSVGGRPLWCVSRTQVRHRARSEKQRGRIFLVDSSGERALSLFATSALIAAVAAALIAAVAAALTAALTAALVAANGRSVLLHLATADRRSILLHPPASVDFCATFRSHYRWAAANGGVALNVLAGTFDRSAIPSAVAITPLGRSVAPALPAIFAAPTEVAPPGKAAAIPAGPVPAIEIEAVAVAFDNEDRRPLFMSVASSAGFSPAPMLIDMAFPLLALIASATAAAPYSDFRIGPSRFVTYLNLPIASSQEGCPQFNFVAQ
jgi:hypothetical protein